MANQDIIPGLDIRETVDGRPSAKSPNRSAAVPAVKRSRPDPYIWGIYIMFLLISVVELFSASSTEVSASNVYSPLIRHSIFLALGLGVVLWLQNTHYILMRRFAWIFAILSLGLLVMSTVAGVEINGAQRAIRVAGMTIQPAEIVKLSVVLLLASILSKNQTPGGVTNRGIITSAIVVVVFAIFLYKDGLTNTILLMGVSISMFLIGGIQWQKFWMTLAIYGLCAGSLMMIKHANKKISTDDFDKVTIEATSGSGRGTEVSGGREETRGNRISRWLEGVHPEDPIDDMNRQVIFSNSPGGERRSDGSGTGQFTRERTSASCILRLHIFHHSRRHRICRWLAAADSVPPSCGTCRTHRLQMLRAFPCVPYHGMRRDDCVPAAPCTHGDCNRTLSRIRSTVAIHIQGRNFGTGHVGGNRHDAFGKPFRRNHRK